MKKLLKIDEVADLLQVKKTTIYSLVHQKRIPYIKISHKILRFRQSEIEAWLDGAHSGTVEENRHRDVSTKRSRKSAIGKGWADNIIEQAMKEVLGPERPSPSYGNLFKGMP